MTAKPFVAAALSLGLLAGCAAPGNQYGSGGYDSGYGTKQTAGTVLGGVVGGLAGSQIGGGTGRIVATGIGTLLGAALGNAAGQSLDRADLAYAEQAQARAYAAPTGETIRWQNPQSGNWGTYTPTREGYTPSGQICREYQTTITIDGRLQQGVGQACQEPDGRWRVVS
ncbi:RT0821/Lpp0805 family surface protein [Azospirillum sp. SYSU D00513]|nr:RT0821/Lpp0805 family surface protein [Azospirillum sp. SYSU D00513]